MTSAARRRRRTNFNPRSPQGGATAFSNGSILPLIFQSTLPARGSDALNSGLDDGIVQLISIHAPRKGERLDADGKPLT